MDLGTQALVRACGCGDPELARAFETVRAEILLRPRDGDALKSEVRDMRERMREELSAEKATSLTSNKVRAALLTLNFWFSTRAEVPAQLGEHLHLQTTSGF